MFRDYPIRQGIANTSFQKQAALEAKLSKATATPTSRMITQQVLENPLSTLSIRANVVLGLRRTKSGRLFGVVDSTGKVVPREEFEEFIRQARLFYEQATVPLQPKRASVPAKPAFYAPEVNPNVYAMALNIQNLTGDKHYLEYFINLAQRAVNANRLDDWDTAVLILKSKMDGEDAPYKPRAWFAATFQRLLNVSATIKVGVRHTHLPYNQAELLATPDSERFGPRYKYKCKPSKRSFALPPEQVEINGRGLAMVKKALEDVGIRRPPRMRPRIN